MTAFQIWLLVLAAGTFSLAAAVAVRTLLTGGAWPRAARFQAWLTVAVALAFCLATIYLLASTWSGR